ncbi:methyltransferase domain-containing protein [Vibrio sp. M260118]|uniref:methyltransferase domain-containing protein n=1 Tax=Vibrio sp. M260118 TaxID=3020896 RepID=UPI002F3E40C0
MKLWGFDLGRIDCSSTKYIKSLPKNIPTVEWLWDEMDRIWDELELDNTKRLSEQAIGQFYSHPIWLVNGVFTAKDEVSKNHRVAVANYLERLCVNNVADYGGGFGELALTIISQLPNSQVEIVEPYPSETGLNRISKCERISIVKDLKANHYQAIIAQDVLEHVEQPIELAYELAKSVQKDGYVIFLNCFYPVIKCHLPATFHLRYNFKSVMRSMGLDYIGTIPGAEHGLVFRKTQSISLLQAKRAERVSNFTGLIKNIFYPVFGNIKRKLQ